jgi:hypothetical protein
MTAAAAAYKKRLPKCSGHFRPVLEAGLIKKRIWLDMKLSEQPGTTDDRKNRKPYSTPQLQIYGDLREITQVVGKNGNDDFAPGGGPSSKTSV